MKEYKISLATAILMNINIMVGTGILIGPGAIAAVAGNASFLCWPLVALLFLPIVISTVQLNRICPGAGGFYAYAKRGLNQTAGYASGLLYIIGYTFAAAVEILALRQTMLVCTGHNWLTSSPILFNAVLTSICIGINLLSLKTLGRLFNSLTIAKIIPLITLILFIPFIINPDFTITASELSALPFALPMAIFGFFGFEYCCSISHLIENSEKNAPRAIMLGFLITALIYTLFHFGALNLMGAENLAKLGAPAFGEFIPFNIPYLKALLALIIPLASLLTLFAGTNGMISANATLLHSMAQEKLFAASHIMGLTSQNGRPWAAILFQGALIFAIATSIPHITIVGGLCNLGVFMSFVLPFVSLLLLKRQSLARRHSLLLTMIALITTLALVVYSWYGLAGTMSDRILYSLPLIGAIGIGFILKRDNN